MAFTVFTSYGRYLVLCLEGELKYRGVEYLRRNEPGSRSSDRFFRARDAVCGLTSAALQILRPEQCCAGGRLRLGGDPEARAASAVVACRGPWRPLVTSPGSAHAVSIGALRQRCAGVERCRALRRLRGLRGVLPQPPGDQLVAAAASCHGLTARPRTSRQTTSAVPSSFGQSGLGSRCTLRCHPRP